MRLLQLLLLATVAYAGFCGDGVLDPSSEVCDPGLRLVSQSALLPRSGWPDADVSLDFKYAVMDFAGEGLPQPLYGLNITVNGVPVVHTGEYALHCWTSAGTTEFAVAPRDGGMGVEARWLYLANWTCAQFYAAAPGGSGSLAQTAVMWWTDAALSEWGGPVDGGMLPNTVASSLCCSETCRREWGVLAGANCTASAGQSGSVDAYYCQADAACAPVLPVSPAVLTQCGNGVLQTGEVCDQGMRRARLDNSNPVWDDQVVCNGFQWVYGSYRMRAAPQPYPLVGNPISGSVPDFRIRTGITMTFDPFPVTSTYGVFCSDNSLPTMTLVLQPTVPAIVPFVQIRFWYVVGSGVDCTNYMIGTPIVAYQYTDWFVATDWGSSFISTASVFDDLVYSPVVGSDFWSCCYTTTNPAPCTVQAAKVGTQCIEYPIQLPALDPTAFHCSALGLCTFSVTSSPTRSSSRSRSQTRSISLSPSQTPSISLSRSRSSTRSTSRSPTVSRSVQPSPSQTGTMVTPSISPSTQPTPSTTRTPKPTPSTTRTPNPTPSNTRSPSNSRTPSSSASVGATPSTTPSPVVVPSPRPPQYDTGLTLGILFGSVGGGLVALVGVSLLFLLITYLRAPHRWVSVPHFRSNALDPGQQPDDLAALVDADL